jgi:RNA polymerase sigma-70 factor (sigma-E family)
MHWLRADGPQRDFERFVTDSTGRLLRSAYLMTSDLAEAEDLVQETLLRVARRWPKVRAMQHPAAYARRILVNLAIDGAGQRARHTGELAASARPGLPDRADRADVRAERDLRAVDTQEELLQALGTLPARQRAVIVLRYWEDLPEPEVAAILGCSAGTVKSTASRGLARLRSAVADGESGHPARARCAAVTSKGEITR